MSLSLKYEPSDRGFTIVEILVAAFIIVTCFFGIMGVSQKFLALSAHSLKLTQASFLLEEGAEAVKTIRDDDWNTLFALSVDTPYYLLFSGGKWTLTETVQTTDEFTRSIRFSRVYRDSADQISASGTLDNGTLLGTVTVSWSSAAASSSKSLSFYIANIL